MHPNDEKLLSFFERIERALEIGAFDGRYEYQFPTRPISLEEVVKNVAQLRDEYVKVRDLRNALLSESDSIMTNLNEIKSRIDEMRDSMDDTIKTLSGDNKIAKKW